MKRLKSISIASQLRYSTLINVTLGLLIIGGVLIYVSFHTQKQQLRALQHERSRSAAGEIDAYIDDLQRKLGYLARVPGLTDLETDIQHNLLEGLVRHNSAYENVAILDRQGQLVTNLSAHGLTLSDSLVDATAFAYAFIRQEDYVGEVEFDSNNKLPYVVMAVPIRNSDDEVDGALLAQINLEFLWFVVSQAQVGETGYAYIIDHRHYMVAQKGDHATELVLEDLSGQPYLPRLISGEIDSLKSYQGLRGQTVLGDIAAIPSMNWYVIVELPTKEAYAPINEMLEVMAIGLLVSITLAVTTGIVISRQIMAPLRALTDAATQLSGGHLEAQVTVSHENELGLLAATFNQMAAQLREMIDRLQRDIMARQQVEQALRESEAQWRSLTENSPDVIVTLDNDLNVLFTNQASSDISIDWLIGSPLHTDPAEEKLGEIRRVLETVLETGKLATYEAAYPAHDGTTLYYEARVSARVLGDERMGLTVGARNITARKETEQQLQNYSDLLEEMVDVRTRELAEAYERLQGLDRAKDEFMTRVSHELRTPLTTIKLKHYLLAKRHPELEQEYTAVLERETRRLMNIVEDMLYAARVGRSGGTLQSQLVNLRDLVRAYVADRATVAETHNLSLQFECHESEIPGTQLDPRLIERVIGILLDNAFNYTPEGGAIRVEAVLRKGSNGAEPKLWVGFKVQDNGYGIPPEEHTQIFERFYRGKLVQTQLTTIPGIGLGLAIAKQIVDWHGGQIEVLSDGQLGHGTVFTVWLPGKS